MKTAFIGGGSFQTIPVVRSAMAEPRVFDGGEINLYDLNVPRAETMGRLLMRTPEFARINCTVRWGTTLDKALDGADAVSVVIPVGSPMVTRLSDQACMRRGFIGSDQLSASGAFRSLTGGRIIWNIAKMEKRCPHAWLACFANPVAVYSGLVNNHTKIKALGVCGGYQNHMWDLTRLMGRDAFCPDYDVEVAGINHCSFIIRGSLHGRDLYRLLARHLTPDWRPPRIGNPWSTVMKRHIRYGLLKLAEQFRKFGVVTFSTEGDGMAHLFYEEMFERSSSTSARSPGLRSPARSPTGSRPAAATTTASALCSTPTSTRSSGPPTPARIAASTAATTTSPSRSSRHSPEPALRRS